MHVELEPSKNEFFLHATNDQTIFRRGDFVYIRENKRSNYNVSGLYTRSCLFNDENVIFSPYSRQLIEERSQNNVEYNFGIIFPNIQNALVVDRKKSYKLQNVILSDLFNEKIYSPYRPSISEIEENFKSLSSLVDNLKLSSEPNDFFNLLNSFTSKINFSVVGFILFELTHEFLVAKGYDEYEINIMKQQIDPSQKKLWSMRSFKLDNLDALGDASAYSLKKLIYKKFIPYLDQFLFGDTYIYDLSLNSIYHSIFNKFEISDKYIDPLNVLESTGNFIRLQKNDIENVDDILDPFIKEQVVVKLLYWEYKRKINSIFDSVVSRTKADIIIPSHSYSREEFIIPSGKWDSKDVYIFDISEKVISGKVKPKVVKSKIEFLK